MRAGGRLFGAGAVFFTLLGVVYWFLAREPAGAAVLIFTGALAFLISFYFLFTARRIEPVPEDDEEGDIAEGAGEQGFYSPHSWWPLAVGGGAATVAMGLVFVMWWMILLGLVATLSAAAGLLFEYYRGEFVRE